MQEEEGSTQLGELGSRCHDEQYLDGGQNQAGQSGQEALPELCTYITKDGKMIPGPSHI